MAQFRVELTVDMNADEAEDAAGYVAEMAEGWSYRVTNLLTGTKVFVHLDPGKEAVIEPYPKELDQNA